MTKPNALVKVSGDLILQTEILVWLKKLSEKYFVVICVGGGTQISQVFEARNLPIRFGDLGRITNTLEERQVARDVLEQNQAELQDLLAEQGIHATVVIPVLQVGSVLCHVNGDVYVLTAYLGFDQLYVLTLKGRAIKKQQDFAKYDKIKVVGF